tara:strand:- start:284 stop:388 length:105 start_codon:yes stop_codon:yes gene_type:complete
MANPYAVFDLIAHNNIGKQNSLEARDAENLKVDY